ncbi:MAG TPA: cyclopropane-fatty-acyl-phospholipid synthase family protein [Casimicrobium sp.]|nr:cyclopropane-fatty-acyl-phospholipid synthase family protein [Casimicrobium sp.]
MSITHNYVTNAPRQSASLPMAARVLFKLLPNLRHGRLTVTLPDRSQHEFGQDGQGIHAHLDIRDLAICSQVLTGGDVAFGEGYFNGLWDTPDLPALLTLLARNQNELMPAFYGRGWKGWLFRLRHILRANSRKQAKKNIEAHYDLGNAFYRVWLDATMTYSSALFERDRDVALDVAQTAKYERILNEINPPAGGHILEIGCGWGGFAEHAAKTRGVRVTGITLSSSQLEYARERIARAGLQSLVRLELCDYRDVAKRLGAQFDGVASIEMFEAVGQKYWASFFKAVQSVLKPGARACVQVITIDESRFEQYAATSDFIQQYIFPGGMLPSPERFFAGAAQAKLAVPVKFEFGQDYAETLRRWLHTFDVAHETISEQGFSAQFIKLWRFYMAYCIAGFEAGSTNVAQYTLTHQAHD